MPNTATVNPFARWCNENGLTPEMVYKRWPSEPGPTIAAIRNWFDGAIPSTAFFMELCKIMGRESETHIVFQEWIDSKGDE